jgi:hypothetical protein
VANLAAITNRLAACIYFADMEAKNQQTVLWDMVPVSKQNWYVKQATKVLKYGASRIERPPRRPAARRASSGD